jgi:hypothetical protein
MKLFKLNFYLILEEKMQAVTFRKICIIRAKDELNGYPTSLALMRRAIGTTNLNIHALLLLHLKNELPQILNENDRFFLFNNQKIYKLILRFKATEFFDMNSLEELRKHLDDQNIGKSSLIFIDSLALLIDQFSLPSTSWLLCQLSELSACVLAMVGGDVGEDEWHKLESLSTTIFQIESNDGNTLCRTMNRKRDETFETKVTTQINNLNIN